VQQLAHLIERLRNGQRVLVAIDGPDAAGKTTLARGLADRLTRPAVTASIDGWHHPRETRLRRGHESAEGYYLDSFNYDALVRECLHPFASGAERIRTATFDYRTDGEVQALQVVAADAVLIFEGVFLLRPELRACWDLAVYLHVPQSVTLTRAVQRDLHLFGSEEDVRQRYERRYLPGQALYRKVAAPLDHADIVMDNSHPAAPVVLKWAHG
jgi:uridine kinase